MAVNPPMLASGMATFSFICVLLSMAGLHHVATASNSAVIDIDVVPSLDDLVTPLYEPDICSTVDGDCGSRMGRSPSPRFNESPVSRSKQSIVEKPPTASPIPYDRDTHGDDHVSPFAFFAAVERRNRQSRFTTLAGDCDTIDKCSGHGKCLPGSSLCICDRDPSLGFWTGLTCGECDFGWAGSDCKKECSGGSCNVCNSHGRCKEGTNGDGTCVCLNSDLEGHFSGTECSQCAPGWFGGECTKSCPGSDVGLACYGRGQCTNEGDGTCTCNPGYDPQSGCRTCDSSHYGPDCALPCPGILGDGRTPCSGHGRCFNGTAGNGTCHCFPGSNYGTANCGVKCPNDCSGFGLCREGSEQDATCDCFTNYAPPDCGVCLPQITGPTCTLPCPLSAKLEICSNRGNCSFRTLSNGTIESYCKCSLGTAGATCEVMCAGDPPCTGHGTCALTDSGLYRCKCFQDSVRGFWTGPLCDTCNVTFNNSITCTRRCPADSFGTICSGRGTCAEGICYCDRASGDDPFDHCGIDCSFGSAPNAVDRLTGACVGCACVYCPDKFRWDTECDRPCQGMDDRGLACSGHGYCAEGSTSNCRLPMVCDPKQLNTGECQCELGYAGRGCQVRCNDPPFAARDACGGLGRGRCASVLNSYGDPVPFCDCYVGFAGEQCQFTCPTVADMICAGHGRCNGTSSGDATCKCDPGYTGTSCELSCACNVQYGTCDFSQCRNLTSYQSCRACVCGGNFSADGLCNDCLPGYQGDTCEGPCVNGKTQGRICNCFTNWSGPACNIPCPRVNDKGDICNGRGKCIWGRLRKATCECNGDWYGPGCEVFCTIETCRASSLLIHPVCNVENGRCQCQDNLQGRWAGLRCDICIDGYWGDDCAAECDCKKHGSCDIVTGECQCYQDEVKGFYKGQQCESCVDGYVGAKCQRRNVAITRITRNSTTGTATFLPPEVRGATRPESSLLTVDSRFGRLFAGYPAAQFDISGLGIGLEATTQIKRAAEVANGTVAACVEPEVVISWFHELDHYLLVHSVTAPAHCARPALILKLDRSDRLNLTTPAPAKEMWRGPADRPGIITRILVADAVSNINLPPDAASASVNVVAFVTVPMVPTDDFNPLTSPLRAKEGGTVTVVVLTDTSNLLVVNRPLDLDARVRDLAIQESPTTRNVQIAIAGGKGVNTVAAELWLFQLSKTDLIPASFSSGFGLMNALPCWSQSILPSAQDSAPAGVCQYCTIFDKVTFHGDNLVVAVATNVDETMMAYVQRTSTLKSTFWAKVRGSCVLANYVSGANTVVDATAAVRYDVAPDFVVSVARSDEINSVATAVAVDKATDVAYVCLSMAAVNRPSVLAKFQLNVNISVYGKRQLNYVATAARVIIPEVFTRLVVDLRGRLLYGLVGFIESPRFTTFLLYEVVSLIPNVADNRGGTLIAVGGQGFGTLQTVFREPLQVTCRVGTSIAAAVSVAASTVVCVAPAISNISEAGTSCNGDPVDINLYGTRNWFTENSEPLKRFETSRLDSVSPDRGSLNGNVVTVHGQGFVESRYSRCKFFSSNPRTSEVLETIAIFESPSRMRCTQPPARQGFADASLLDITIDGQLWTGPVPYLIVGVASNLSSASVPVDTADVSRFALSVATADSENHRLLSLDTTAREVCLQNFSVQQAACDDVFFSWRQPDDGYPYPPCRNNTINQTSGKGWCRLTQQGTVDFDDLEMLSPREGDMIVTFQEQRFGWQRQVLVTVREGLPFALAILNRVSLKKADILPSTPLTPGPEIVVIDRWANVVTTPSNLDVQAKTYFVLDSDNSSFTLTTPYSITTREAGAKIVFTQMQLRFWHGASHLVNFSSPGLVGVQSDPFRTQKCDGGTSQFKMANSDKCENCPSPGAECWGNETVTVLPGFWRGETIKDIYGCPAGATVCLGSSASALEGSNCAPGYEGTLCAQCAAGFGKAGKASCAKCDAVWRIVMTITAVGVGAILLLLGWTFVTLRTAEVTDVSVILRTVVNHMQATGELGAFSTEWSPFLKSMFDIQSTGSSLSFGGVASVDCLLRYYGRNHSLLFTIYMMLPLVSLAMAAGMFGVVRFLKMQPVISKKLRDEIEADLKNFAGAQSGVLLRRYPLYMVLITTFCVSMFTFYQTLITQSTSVLRCAEHVVKTGVTEYYLKIDYSFKCESPEKHSFRNVALLCAIGYGFGVPIAFVVGYLIINGRVAGAEQTKLMFMFLIGGYKEKYWFWQAVIMIRKMILVLIVVLIDNNSVLQAYSGMWVMSIALMVQLWFQPCEKDEHNLVEALSLAIITVTLNLGLLYFVGLAPFQRDVLTGVIFLITLAAICMFVYFLYEPVKAMLIQRLQTVASIVDGLKRRARGQSDNDVPDKVLRFRTIDERLDQDTFDEGPALRLDAIAPRFRRSRGGDGTDVVERPVFDEEDL